MQAQPPYMQHVGGLNDILLRCRHAPTQVQDVFEKHKGEGILGVVNLMGDYQYVPMADLEADDIMTMVQVGAARVRQCDRCRITARNDPHLGLCWCIAPLPAAFHAWQSLRQRLC